MARKCLIENNKRRQRLVAKYYNKRKRLKDISNDLSLNMEEKFNARLKLAALPRNSAVNRVSNRCAVSGRGRGCYRKFKLSRIMLRELGNKGLIPGLVKSSW